MNKLALFKNRAFCNDCNKLVSVFEGEVYCIPQDGIIVCGKCYKKSYENRDDVLVISD